jgi:hypothetical protein
MTAPSGVVHATMIGIGVGGWEAGDKSFLIQL